MAVDLIKPVELTDEEADWTGNWRSGDVWAVLNAARDGDLARLRTLLDDDPTLVRAEYWYTPPLHLAVREGHLDAAKLLVETGADLTHRSLYGGEPLLQIAEDRNRHDVADYLRGEFKRQADSASTNHAIHEAVSADDPSRAEELLAADPSLANRGDVLGRRPLHLAVDAGNKAMVDLLLRHGAKVDATGFSAEDRLGGSGFRPVVLALWHTPYWRQRNDYAMARHLLDRGARYSMTVAAALGDADRVRELLRADRALADEAESCGKRPLSAAAERGHGEIVDLLLDAGADPKLPEGPMCPHGHALWAAARFGFPETAERLLVAGADPNGTMESSGTPTGSAKDADMRALLYRYGGRVGLDQHAHDGNIDTIAALLDAKPALFDEIRTTEVFTLAVSARHESIVRLLLARGLRVPSVVTYCQSYLWRHPDLARLLLEHGMDPSLPNWQRVTPLHDVAAKGDIDTAKLFLEFGADPNAVDEEYRTTPLGWAARAGQTDFVRFALQNGFDPSVPTGPDWARPAAWARRRGHAETADVLGAHR